jgi:hypothetical protein
MSLRRIVGNGLKTPGPITMSSEHGDLEAKAICSLCELPGNDSDILQQLCCTNILAHRRCILAEKNVVKCQACMLAELGKRPLRRTRRRLTCCGYLSIAFPILVMMIISSYLLPPLIGQWFFKVPYGKLPLTFFSFDTYFMFTLEALAFLSMWLCWACCICCGRGFIDACCCCCWSCWTKEEVDVKAQ